MLRLIVFQRTMLISFILWFSSLVGFFLQCDFEFFFFCLSCVSVHINLHTAGEVCLLWRCWLELTPVNECLTCTREHAEWGADCYTHSTLVTAIEGPYSPVQNLSRETLIHIYNLPKDNLNTPIMEEDIWNRIREHDWQNHKTFLHISFKPKFIKRYFSLTIISQEGRFIHEKFY